MLLYFLFGTIFGSAAYCFFMNTANVSHFLFKRSACDHCSHTLQWYELIPLVSYLICFGRCRHCGTHITSKYIFIELFMGLLFSIFLPFIIFDQLYFLPSFIIISLMIVSDIHNYYVTDKLQLCLLISFLFYFYNTELSVNFLSSIIVLIILFLLQILLPNTMGGADIKFIGLVCLLLPISLVPFFLLLSSTLGLFSFLLLDLKFLPFIPCLSVSFFIMFFHFI